MKDDPIRRLKYRALLYAVAAILLIAVGIKFKIGMCFFPIAIGVLAYLFLTRSVASLLTATNLNREQYRQFREAFDKQFARHNLPKQIFWLLFAVTEADGQSGTKERDMVRRFLLERFTDPATAADLRQWEADRLPPEQVGALALGLGRMLSPSERETVFSWCCLVAFADEKYSTEEHIMLQTIARSFGFEGHHARRIFHYAKSVHMSGGQHQQRGYQQHAGGGGGSRGYGGGSAAHGAVSDRGHALKVLGLEPNATAAEIKKRHRELVRQFHPDRHQHLGDVAAKEAEERFREIQAAYELLAA